MTSSAARDIPRLGYPDSTLAFLRDGYDFVSKRCDRLGTDAFRTRMMLTPVVCMRGQEAADYFYAPGRMTRQGAMPQTVVRLLQDKGSVQTLDGEAHRIRKALFLGMMTDEALREARAILAEELRRAMAGWQGRTIELSGEIDRVMCRTALAWCGFDPEAEDVEARTQEFSIMVAAAGSVGPSRLRAARLRERSEKWAAAAFAKARSDNRHDSWVVERFLAHRDSDGTHLPDEVCAVELLNVLRPIVAVGRYIVFLVHAMNRHPELASAHGAGDDAARHAFCDEVRRLYPFFPVIGGRVLEPFDWRGTPIERGEWLLLDLFGTCRDPQAWESPTTFDPSRHVTSDTHNRLIPQGGGNLERGHRCPGETLTRALLAEALGVFLGATYSVPSQDLSIPHRRMPTSPAGGMQLQFP